MIFEKKTASTIILKIGTKKSTFFKGRVDNIRAATSHSLQFCKHIHDDPSEISNKSADYLSRAIKFQTHITQLAITGRGLGKVKN